MNIGKLLVLMIFTLSYYVSTAQVICSKQIGRIVYYCSNYDRDSIIKQHYSILGDKYIENYYKFKKIPLIYIDVMTNNYDLPVYELAYDNLKGNSLENKLYDRKEQYELPGIRIKIFSKQFQPEQFLKLLDYGIVNLKELKRIRKNALNEDYYNQPQTLSLSQEKIKLIIFGDPSQNMLNVIKSSQIILK